MAFAQEPPTVRIGPSHVHALSEADLVQRVLDRIDAGQGGWIVTVNLDHLRRFDRDPEYALLCARATYRVADGMPIVWASRLQGTPLPERVAGSNLISSLSAAAAKRGRSVALLGGLPGIAEAAAAALRASHPGLRVAGVLGPNLSPDPVDVLRTMRPDIVYVSLGKIVEERLIERVRDALPTLWLVGVGSSFALLSGHLMRAPRWVQNAGLEWLHRWVQEPRRLTGRYIRNIPLAIRLLLDAALRNGPWAGRQ